MGASTTDMEKQVEIEFLYLDLDLCTRCKGTNDNLETALRTVQEVLQASGADVSTRKVLVESEETARELRFVSSPTIRINGRDIALDFRETPCDSCAEACFSPFSSPEKCLTPVKDMPCSLGCSHGQVPVAPSSFP